MKEIEYLSDTSGILVKKIKPNFKSLGPKYGKLMKEIAGAINNLNQKEIVEFEKNQSTTLEINGEQIVIGLEDAEVMSEDIPGWLVANEGKITIALDVSLSEELISEGIAREFVNRIQNIRKESDFDVTDKIKIEILKHDAINNSIVTHMEYIATQTLAVNIELLDSLNENSKEVEISDEVKTRINISRII